MMLSGIVAGEEVPQGYKNWGVGTAVYPAAGLCWHTHLVSFEAGETGIMGGRR